MNNKIHLVECPRDAMQGWPHFIPTQSKIKYINALLRAGFDTIDVGSFVSPKAIPQMADTKDVLKGIDIANSASKLLCIVANVKGGEEAVVFDAIDYLGFPFSISETFQQRNTNSSIETSFSRVEDLQDLCIKNQKKLVVYISMGFGNPYGDPYNEDIVMGWLQKLTDIHIDIISIADTVGLAGPGEVSSLLKKIIPTFHFTEIGVHLHSAPRNLEEKLDAALMAGCRKFDGALKGIGGCPMAGDALVGNMDTERMVEHFHRKGYELNIDKKVLQECSMMTSGIFI